MFKSVLNAVKAYLGTLKLISKLKLWKFFIIPIIISLITASIVFGLAYGLSDNIGGFISSFWKWDFGKEVFTSISSFFGGLVIVFIGFILYKHIVLALSSPFMSPVSEKIEVYLNEDSHHKHLDTTFKDQLIRGVRLSIRNICKELLFTIPLLIFGWIPVIGWCFTFLAFVIQAYYAGFGNIDYTLERHLSYKESIDFVKKNRGLAIGNGIVFMLFLLIPVIGFIFVLPLSVTAATTETIKKIEVNQIEE